MRVMALDFAELVRLCEIHELQRSTTGKSGLSLLERSARNPFSVSAIKV